MPATEDAPRRRAVAVLGQAATTLVGVVLGGAMAVVAVPVALVALLVAAVTAPAPSARASARRSGTRAAERFATLDLRRLRRFLHHEAGPPSRRPRRLVGYLALRVLAGPPALVLVAVGLAVGFGYLAGTLVLLVGPGLPASSVIGGLGVGVVALYLTGQVTAGAAALDRRLATRVLDTDTASALRQRVRALAASRAEVIAAVDDERRRIERDLHDGVQQRVVALAMLLGRARRSPDAAHAEDLHRQAHEDAQALLSELREVTWRVFPAVLDDAGLHAAVETLAERCPLPVAVCYDVSGKPPPAVAVAAYFVVSEAVTNTVKHAGATSVRIELREEGAALRVRVTDDGAGGAEPTGSGLAGLARRVQGLDGELVIESPPGGPTTVTAELPCV